MTYPIAVVVVAVIVSGILLVKVVPQFQELFSGFGANLPAFTVMVIHLSEWMQEWWLLILIGIIFVIGGFRDLKRKNKNFSDAVDRYVLRIPVVGNH